jgi:hypothetical protein
VSSHRSIASQIRLVVADLSDSFSSEAAGMRQPHLGEVSSDEGETHWLIIDRADKLGLCQFSARHLEVDLVDRDLEEGGEERCVLPRRDGAALVVAEAEVGREPGAAPTGRPCG